MTWKQWELQMMELLSTRVRATVYASAWSWSCLTPCVYHLCHSGWVPGGRHCLLEDECEQGVRGSGGVLHLLLGAPPNQQQIAAGSVPNLFEQVPWSLLVQVV